MARLQHDPLLASLARAARAAAHSAAQLLAVCALAGCAAQKHESDTHVLICFVFCIKADTSVKHESKPEDK
jgi:hypothetical protein